MTTLHTVSFQKTVLASLIGLCLNQSAFALQEISDDGLSQATGEGIALLPQDAYLIFQGEKATTIAEDLLDRTKDTGYINYVPVGPLSKISVDTGGTGNSATGKPDGLLNQYDRAVGKADIYLYGLSISRAGTNYTTTDKKNETGHADYNDRVGMDRTIVKDGSGVITSNTPTAVRAISSWGTVNNPWIFKATTTENPVPNFATGTNCDGTTSTGCGVAAYQGKITYLALEAPLYEYTYTGTTTPVQATTYESGGDDAYKLKLGLWADIFVRNPYVKDQDSNNTAYPQFKYGTATGLVDSTTGISGAGTQDPTRANRLRLQGIWNNFSLNGSNLKVFQTLNGASTAGGLSPFYNNTLGMAGILRFNSGDGSTLLGTDTTGTITKYQATTNRYSTVYLGQENTNQTYYNTGSDAAKYRLRTIDTTYTNTAASWTVPDNLNDKVLRLSTRETSNYNCSTEPVKCLQTPALNSILTAPTFDANEGVFIYNLNTNLVLGNLYQPVILGSDGKNFSLEIARIPNKQEIYSKIYTRYAGDTGDSGVTYSGSTCNVYQCGGTVEIGGRKYQGSNATHSSISIGTVYSDDGGKTLKANTTGGAVGISFGKLQSNTISASTQYYYQLQKQERRNGNSGNRWEYMKADGTWDTTSGGNACNGGTKDGGCYNEFNQYAAWRDVDSFNAACIATTNITTGTCGGYDYRVYQILHPDTAVNTKNKTDRQANTGTAGTGSTVVTDMGYAPNTTHAGYTVGQGWGKFGWTPPAYGYHNNNTDDRKINIATGKWDVPAWGSTNRDTYTGSNPNNSVQTESNIIANILSMYASSAANNSGTDKYSGTTWSSRIDNTAYANLATPTQVTTGVPAGMTMYKSAPQTFSANPINNMGSAVIDGLLIQHLKVTTTGL